MRQSPLLDRREALLLAGGGLVVACSAPDGSASAQTAPGRCILTPESVEGPFYLDPKLERADIDEGRPGIPMELVLTVIDAADCAPMAGARIDVWHCDAGGAYSGFAGQRAEGDTEGKTFLRGHQATDRAGAARFHTIWPGWYPGRAPHVHFKVLLKDDALLTAQIYFPDALNRHVFASHPAYDREWTNAASNQRDGIFGDNQASTVASVTPRGAGYEAKLTIGVDRRARSNRRF